MSRLLFSGMSVLLVLLLIVFLLVSFGLVDLEEIRLRPHAIAQHGEAARTARDVIHSCGQGILVFNCPATLTSPDTYLFVCPLDSTKVNCAGMYVGTHGAELTSWIMPCSKWLAKTAVCITQ